MDGRIDRDCWLNIAEWCRQEDLSRLALVNHFFNRIANDTARHKLRAWINDAAFHPLIDELKNPSFVWFVWRLFQKPAFRRRSQRVLDPFWFSYKDPCIWYCLDDDLARFQAQNVSVRDYLPLALVFCRQAITHYFLKTQPITNVTPQHAKWFLQSAFFSGVPQMVDRVRLFLAFLGAKVNMTHETFFVAANSLNPAMVQIARDMACDQGEVIFLTDNLRIIAGLVDAQTLLAEIKALPALHEAVFRVNCMHVIVSERLNLLRDLLQGLSALPVKISMTICEVDCAASTGNLALFDYVMSMAQSASLRPTAETLEKALLSGSVQMVCRVHAWGLKMGVRFKYDLDQLVAALGTGQEDLYEFVLGKCCIKQPSMKLLHAAIGSGNKRLAESILVWAGECNVALVLTEASLLTAIHSRNPSMLRYVFELAKSQGVDFNLNPDNLLLAEPKQRSPWLGHHLMALWAAPKTTTPK